MMRLVRGLVLLAMAPLITRPAGTRPIRFSEGPRYLLVA